MPHRFLDHIADVRVECCGETIEELFESAMEALYAVALQKSRHETSCTETVCIEGDGLEDLLVRWLQELIYLLDVKRFAASAVQFHRLDATGLHAVIEGYSCAPEDRETEVKAATYHGMAITRPEGRYVAQALFDL